VLNAPVEAAILPRVPAPNLIVDSLLSLICARVGVNLKTATDKYTSE